MELLGDDGRGYELARKLEACGVWRAWLGDSYYSTFIHFLSSPASWESFMRVDESKSKTQIYLQFRVRALLFDKAAVTLFLPSNQNFSSVSVSNLNQNYLQLHGDDVYFTLESSSQDVVQKRESGVASNKISSKNQSKSGFSAGSRYGEPEFDSMSQIFRTEELLETWYDQFIEKYRVSRPYKLSLGDQELDKRTPEEMSAYLRLQEKHKRRHVPFQDDQYTNFGNSVADNSSNKDPKSTLDVSNSTDGDLFLPETMFALNCVPGAALLQITREKTSQKVEFNGVLDTLPQVMSRSPVMIERLGIRPEYLGMEQGGNLHHGTSGSEGNRKYFGEKQASQISQRVIAHMLTGVGFEGAREVPLESLSELLGNHICKLGRILKALADNYRHQCSALELLQMFLHTTGHSFGNLAELVKDGTRNVVQQSQQHMHGMQSQQQSPLQSPPQSQQQLPLQLQQQSQQQSQQQLQQQLQQQSQQHSQQQLQQQSQQQLQHQSPLRLPQQMSRQMNQQVQQMVQPQNLVFQQLQQQQQLERLRMRLPSTPRPGMDMDKDRATSQVSAENSLKLPTDANAINASATKQTQMQFRQQQLNAISNLHAQSGTQFRQLTSLQIPQMQTQNPGVVRAPPLKVDGFQELMGGDASLKHDSEENKLTSPTSK